MAIGLRKSATAPQSVPVAELLDAVGADNPVGYGRRPRHGERRRASTTCLYRLPGIERRTRPRQPQFLERPKPPIGSRATETHRCHRRHTHQPVHVNFLSKNLFWLDGTRTVDDLIDHLTQRTLDGELNMQRDGNPVTNEDEIRRIMAETVPTQLVDFADRGLLVA